MKKVFLKKHVVNEEGEGGMSTTLSTPGMGNPVPPSVNNFGSGDIWGGKPIKRKKKKIVAESYQEFVNHKKGQ